MLSKKAFLAKHSAKYSKLSSAQKDQRYQSYLRSSKKPTRTRAVYRPKQRKFPRTAMDSCVREYAYSLANPFVDSGACLPMLPAVPSMKTRMFSKGTMWTGTAGVGFIAWHPNCLNNETVTDRMFEKHSIAAYGGIDIASSSQIGVSDSNSNSPYNNGDFAVDQISWRVVSAGIRIRYTGTELDRGGSIITCVQPDNTELSTSTVTALLKYRTAKRYPVTRDWVSVTYTPVSPSQFDYSQERDHGGFGNDVYPIAIMVDAPNTTALSFEFEVSMNVEFIGNIVYNRTATPARQEAASDVLSAARAYQSGYPLSAATAGASSSYPIAAQVYDIFQSVAAATAVGLATDQLQRAYRGGVHGHDEL